MEGHKFKPWRACIAAVSVVALGLQILGNGGAQVAAQGETGGATSAGAGTRLFFPFVGHSDAPAPPPMETPSPMPDPNATPVPTPVPRAEGDTAFGIEMESVASGGDMVAAAGTTFVRRNGLLWSDVEPTQGARNWSRVAALEAELIQAARLNLKIILVVRHTPTWARKHANSPCGPIRSDKLDAFGAFMRDVVARYSQAPYNVKYWELGNEPDGPVADSDMPYGCWGENSDGYFGGAYYARMLQAAYGRIKSADPQARVLIGGLMIVCDPEPVQRRWTCANERFFEGILAGGGGPYFDGVSFHTYDYFYAGADVGTYEQQGWLSAWNTTGPVVVAKARYFRRTLERFGVHGKFLINTEMALICWECPTLEDHEVTKAYYIAQAYAATIAEGVTASLWYSLFGWFGSHLLGGDMTPTRAFNAYTVARQKLGTAAFVGAIQPGDVGGSGEVLGYKFKRDGRDVWLVWSKNGQTQSIRFPSSPASITGAMGERVNPATTYALTIAPVYVEW